MFLRHSSWCAITRLIIIRTSCFPCQKSETSCNRRGVEENQQRLQLAGSRLVNYLVKRFCGNVEYNRPVNETNSSSLHLEIPLLVSGQPPVASYPVDASSARKMLRDVAQKADSVLLGYRFSSERPHSLFGVSRCNQLYDSRSRCWLPKLADALPVIEHLLQKAYLVVGAVSGFGGRERMPPPPGLGCFS